MLIRPALMARSIDDVAWLWLRTPRLQIIDTTKTIDEKWFRSFKKEWKLPRSIKKKGNAKAVCIINEMIKKKAFECGNPDRVSELSLQLVKHKITYKGNQQLSLASKIAFYVNSEHYLPFDKYSRKGLSKLRRSLKQVGDIGFTDYVTYIKSFNEMYLHLKHEIKTACEWTWVEPKIAQIGLDPETSIRTERFRRKILDNYLMWLGGIDPYCDPVP